MNTETLSEDSTDRATVNIKRTTVTAFLVMIIIGLAALTTIISNFDVKASISEL
ncbi:hypothetical protein [Pseudomonas kilonensis]|uniref:Uncharacterized protein n=1 Tax=Pseudomonas kilonensis TaxID=132476 RepID=A0ABY0ZIH5_9PSED|nr:hypothetical protein [Pseudomonas kilonensis]SEE76099.1 hypothetical protein SAMN04490188_5582 [Pseudomonas kilonensis]